MTRKALKNAAARARAVKFADTQGALRRELRLAPTADDQLELTLSLGPIAIRTKGEIRRVVSRPCKTCKRWNYHLVDCKEAG